MSLAPQREQLRSVRAHSVLFSILVIACASIGVAILDRFELLLPLGIVLGYLAYHYSRTYQSRSDRIRSRILAALTILSVGGVVAMSFAPYSKNQECYVLRTVDETSSSEGLARMLSEVLGEPRILLVSTIDRQTDALIASTRQANNCGLISIASAGGVLTAEVGRLAPRTSGSLFATSHGKHSRVELTGAGMEQLLDEISRQLSIPREQLKCDSCLSDDPSTNSDYLHGLASYYSTTSGGFRDAIEAFSRALDRRPDFALARAGLGESMAQLVFRGWIERESYADSAIAFCEEAVRRRPDMPQCQKALGVSYVARYFLESRSFSESGRNTDLLTQAKRATDRALQLNENYSLALNNLVFIYTELGEYKLAELACQRAISASPGYYLPRVNQAFRLIQEGRYFEAMEQAERAIELAPDTAGLPYAVLARAYAESGDYATAALLLDGIEQFPDFDYHFLLSQLFTPEQILRIRTLL